MRQGMSDLPSPKHLRYTTFEHALTMPSSSQHRVRYPAQSLLHRHRSYHHPCLVHQVAAQPAGILPTQSLHPRASPRACSQQPISHAGNPASFAHARFESHLSCVNLDARIKDTRKVRRGHNNGEGRGGSLGRSSDGVCDFFSTLHRPMTSGIGCRPSSSIRMVGGMYGASSL